MRTRDEAAYAAEDTSDSLVWYSTLEGGLNHEEMHKAEYSGSIADTWSSLDAISASVGTIANHDPDGTATGNLSGTEFYDAFTVDLVAGQTYTFALRGTDEGGIEDPYLALFGPSGYITEDDDGGLGRTSMITYTATETGTYELWALSWYSIAGLGTDIDTGDYTIDIWSPDPAEDPGDTFATAYEVTPGTEYGYLDTAADVDLFKIETEAGMYYTFTYAGGIAGAAELSAPEPGENIAYLDLFDADGNFITYAVNYETTLGFFAEEGGTYYVAASSYAGLSGGYTIDIAELDPADFDPLDSINWVNADNIPVDENNVATVYFAVAGEDFGEGIVSNGWNDFEVQQVMLALGEYTKITGITYEITTEDEGATFRLINSTGGNYGAYMYPNDPAYGDATGISAYNTSSGGWTLDVDGNGDQESLYQGGFSFAVVLHEMGHGHGLAHPHDTGGGSDVMLGANNSAALGVYDLNQGVYTVMSYNDAWQTNPDGAQPLTLSTLGYGWSGSLSAFDIAQLQARYGVHAYNEGDNVYMLPDTNEFGTYFETIWDSGGTDEIAYDGERDVRIDLLAATLDYTPTGGGVVSWAEDVKGGYTIANGVVIENATGGSGDDGLLGNAFDNVLSGNAGDDILMGREGDDLLLGGTGFDVASYADAAGSVSVNLSTGKSKGADGKDALVSIEGLVGSAFDDSLFGDSGDNTLDGGDGDDALQGGKGDDTLLGGAGDDHLSGGNGDDILNGGTGNDVLIGGGGNNTFVFDVFDGSVDQVKGYSAKKDSIEIDSDGDVTWLAVEGGTQLFVDDELVAMFSGTKAEDMAGEWAGSEVAFALEGAGSMSASPADLYAPVYENMA